MSGKAFDAYANTYDSEFSETGIGMAQRALVWKYSAKVFQKGSSVLEVNCGTGVDAFHFATQVKSWYGTDASHRMVEVCNKKLKESPLPSVRFDVSDATDLKNISPSSVDVLFSNFAGLNCLSPDQLNEFAQHSTRLLNQNGKLVLVFLGKKCLWENLYFRWKGDARFRRRERAGGVSTEIDGQSFQTWYYSPNEVLAAFPHHKITTCKGIGFFIPPSFMIRHFPEGSWQLRFLKQLERLSSLFTSLANYSDHFIMILEKNN
jgi:ubiquinone/menaquinone biosynthesis C-methylase UbiE